MARLCPVSGIKIDEKVARCNAFITIIVLGAFLITGWEWIIFLLTVDFFLRGFFKGKASPVAAISKQIVKSLDLKPEMIDAGPKFFAAKIGCIFCLAISIFSVFSAVSGVYIVGSILMICAAVEAFFGYCVGCKMYSLVCRKT